MVRQHTGRDLAKDDPELLRVHAELARQFESGRQSAVEWEEVRELLEPGADRRSPVPGGV